MTIFSSVTELTQAITQAIKKNLQKISVRGEVSELKRQSSGHIYFSLKDESSKISAVLFKGVRIPLKNTLKDGDVIDAHGTISIYPPRGSYQIIVESAQYAGMGEAQQNLQALFKKIQQLGWCDDKHKRPLPPFPKRFGVITSPSGSVLHDVIHVLTRRQKKFQLLLHPVSVQGATSPQEIVQAIKNFNAYDLVDVILLVRGGGGPEDLRAFNTETVAEAIWHSNIPIVSGVGHETDLSICDFVADLRAPTPSAAAEVASFNYQQTLENLNKYSQFFGAKTTHKIELCHKHLDVCKKHPKWIEKKIPPYFFLKLQDIQDSIIEKNKIIIKNKNNQVQKSRAIIKTLALQKWINNKKYQLTQCKKLCLKNSLTPIQIQRQRIFLSLKHLKRYPQNYINQKRKQLHISLCKLPRQKQQQKKNALYHIKNSAHTIIRNQVRSTHSAFKKTKLNLLSESKQILQKKKQALHRWLQNLKNMNLQNKPHQACGKLHHKKTHIRASVKSIVKRKQWQTEKVKSLINSLKPENLLRKGFAIAFAEKDNSVILSKEKVVSGMPLIVRVSDGEILVRVEKVIR